MYRKRAYIIFGTLLLVSIFGATGVYVYFSWYKLSPINESFCYGTAFTPPFDLSPEQTKQIRQRVTADTGTVSITGVGGLTFYYTRPIAKMTYNRQTQKTEVFETIMADLKIGQISADTAETRLLAFHQAKYTDKPVDPIITTGAEHLRTDTVDYALNAYEQYLYWHTVALYHWVSLQALEIVDATLQIQWRKNKKWMCETALALAEEAYFSLYRKASDGTSFIYMPNLEPVKEAAARLAVSYENKEALTQGRADTQRQIDQKKEQLKQLIQNTDTAYAHYAAYTQACNKRNPTDADNITLIRKRGTPKLLLDTVTMTEKQ